MNQWVPLGPPSPPPVPLPASVSFSGDRRGFFRLVAGGAALELVTVGFYRFWLATDIRRHLWSSTEVDGDAAEYTGRGKELLIGFLFALAIIVPVYLAYFIAGLEAERLKAFASIPLFVFFYLFGQFAIYRARRYRLTRTVWRGVRFWMDGSGWAYAARSALLIVVLPIAMIPLARFSASLLSHAKALSVVVSLLIPVTAPFLYGVFKAIEWRWWISGLRLGGVRFESNLLRGALVGLYWKVIGWSLLISVCFGAYLFGCAALVAKLSQMPMTKLFVAGSFRGSIPMLVAAAIGYLTFILAMNVVIRMYLLRDLWVRVAESVTVHELEAAADVAATGDLANAIGEGLADGLDVVGF